MTDGEPRRLDDVDGAHRRERDEHQQAGDGQHQERDQLVLEVARLLLDAPGMIDGRGDGAEDAHRRPGHQEAAGDAERPARGLQRPHLVFDEAELSGKVADDEAHQRVAIGVAAGHAGDDREREQEEREQGEQRIVGDRRGERHVVAVVDADDAAPDGKGGQPDFRAYPRQRPAQAPVAASHRLVHATIIARRGCPDGLRSRTMHAGLRDRARSGSRS